MGNREAVRTNARAKTTRQVRRRNGVGFPLGQRMIPTSSLVSSISPFPSLIRPLNGKIFAGWGSSSLLPLYPCPLRGRITLPAEKTPGLPFHPRAKPSEAREVCVAPFRDLLDVFLCASTTITTLRTPDVFCVSDATPLFLFSFFRSSARPNSSSP